MNSLSSKQLATEIISAHKRPVVTRYELGVELYLAIAKGRYGGRPLRLKTSLPERRHYTGALNFLTKHGLLKNVRGLRQAFTILAQSRSVSVDEIVCRADPFAYLSHLSAMQFHGLTDRMTQTVFLSSPSPAQWSEAAQQRMARDLGSRVDAYEAARYPQLTVPRMDKVVGQPVHVSHRRHLGAFRHLKSTGLRVSTIGRTFLDMLRDPDLCGGIHHVLSVFDEHAKDHLGLIVDDIDCHGTTIDKMRAGYVLSERLGLRHETIETWRALVQRGGSRKLYAKNDYSPTYSERWAISLNVD